MHQQKGLSLVELMISITLGLILMAGVVQLFVSSRMTFSSQQGMSRVQETGRLAIDFIAQDARMAGYVGGNGFGKGVQSSPDAIPNRVTATPNIFNNYAQGVSVYTSAVAGIASLANTDILAIRSIFSGNTMSLIKATPTLLTVKLAPPEIGACADGSNRLNGLCSGQSLIISDLYKTTAFTATSLTISGAELHIGLSGWGGDENTKDSFFAGGAQIGAISTHVYFIKNNAAGRPSLFQNIDNGGDQELLEGVRDLAVSYSRQNTPNVYVAGSGIGPLWATDINPVVSLRVELLVQSAEDNVVEAPQVYNFAGANVTATDRRLYQVFTSTIALRAHLL